MYVKFPNSAIHYELYSIPTGSWKNLNVFYVYDLFSIQSSVDPFCERLEYGCENYIHSFWKRVFCKIVSSPIKTRRRLMKFIRFLQLWRVRCIRKIGLLACIHRMIQWFDGIENNKQWIQCIEVAYSKCTNRSMTHMEI